MQSLQAIRDRNLLRCSILRCFRLFNFGLPMLEIDRGRSGYVGTAFRQCLDRRGIKYRNVRRSECDYHVPERLDELIAEVSPELLINTAGFTGGVSTSTQWLALGRPGPFGEAPTQSLQRLQEPKTYHRAIQMP